MLSSLKKSSGKQMQKSLLLFLPLAFAAFRGDSAFAQGKAPQISAPEKPLLEQKWWREYRKTHIIKPDPTPQTRAHALAHSPARQHKRILKGKWRFTYEKALMADQNALSPPQAGILRFIAENNSKNTLTFILNPLSDDVLSPTGEKLPRPIIREDAVAGLSPKSFNCTTAPLRIWFGAKESFALKNVWCENHLVIGALQQPHHLEDIPAYNQQRQKLAVLLKKNLPTAISQGQTHLRLHGSAPQEAEKFRNAAAIEKNTVFFKAWQDYWFQQRQLIETQNQETLRKANAILEKSAQKAQENKKRPALPAPALPFKKEGAPKTLSEQENELAETLKALLKNPSLSISQKTL